MQVRWIVSAVLVAAIVGFLAGHAFTEDAAPSEEETAKMMEMMKKLGTPGEAHKGLEPMIGDWDVVSKMWMQPGEPTVTKATNTNTWFMGGRFVKTTYKGDFMGESFDGASLMGYDNFKKQYQSIWMDSWSTGISFHTGSREGNTITMHGTWEGPQGKMTMRMVHEFVDADTMVMTGYMVMGEEEMKHMELTYTRQKAAPAATSGVSGPCCPSPDNRGPGY